MAELVVFATFVPAAIAWNGDIHAFLQNMADLTGVAFEWAGQESILAEVSNEMNFNAFFHDIIPAAGHIVAQVVDNPIDKDYGNHQQSWVVGRDKEAKGIHQSELSMERRKGGATPPKNRPSWNDSARRCRPQV
ncbi:uncharacterized protein LOC119407213 isoform X2 [Rhipicephalus sanguineus]|uniref:uncharacterized protein LOC119407213 isoform X2 n=1 Tax=Rhipicephalus sanguineus TaxID=34632 RepID=UPI0018939471|nr:uncharacterized protein LOC119407213 isoform X2 [Rhipicephalus sanguineus]